MKKRLVVLTLLLILVAASSVAALQLTIPKFGVAQDKTFDITITTAATVCKYSSPFQKTFDEMIGFEKTGSTHTIIGFEVPSFGTEYDFFVNCDNGGEAASLKLKADNSNPSISSAKVEPVKIVQTPLETTLKVTTSEDTSCKYDETAEEYDDMTDFISGSDDDKQNYQSEHEKLLTLTDDKDYTLNVMCKDLSGRKTSLAIVTFKVNTSAEPEIIEFTPKHDSYTNEDTVVISVTTNKNSVCKYDNETDPKKESGTFKEQGTLHQYTVQLEERTHTYYFKCVFEGPRELTAQTTFTIDKTKPIVLFVDDDQNLADAPEQYTYYTDKLKAKWKGEDNESGIKAYNYSIVSGSRVIVEWTTTTDEKETVRDLELENGKQYVFRVRAQNNAGLWSETEESDGVKVDISLNVEQACKNDVKDGDETAVDFESDYCKACLSA